MPGPSAASDADYYVIGGRHSLNTLSADQVTMLRGVTNQDVVERVIKMPLISVNHLIEKYLGQAPDLVSIDVEGLDGRTTMTSALEWSPGECPSGLNMQT